VLIPSGCKSACETDIITVTYFTNLIYISIQFAVGNGDSAPFVGHNSFLRWRALQSVSLPPSPTPNNPSHTLKHEFWSSDHVSEDFDMSLRLQMAGFIIRLATYHSVMAQSGDEKGAANRAADGRDREFKEGVSLTVYDELARWEKYAYGCNELVFRPIWMWWKGPFTGLFWRFLWSDIKITSKVTILAYIGTCESSHVAFSLAVASVEWIY
jgi:hypothetical protein